jgi:3-mercaptopyruvate sulfurtransferase SseA
LAVPESAAQVAPPTKLAIMPTVAGPAVATAAAQPASAQVEVKRITPAELQKRLAEPNPPLVWELRSPDRYEQGHIPGSQLIAVTEVAALAEKLDRSQAIVTSCD